MWFSRITTAIALLIWSYFTVLGFDGMASVAAQHAEGYPSAAQWKYYVYMPLGLAAVSLVLAAVAWGTKKNAPIGCAGLVMIAAWFVYVLQYTGGI